MSHIDQKTVKKLTRLSRISCTQDEETSILQDLEKILSYIDLLQEVDTKGVDPCFHVLEDIVNVMREDRVGETLAKELFLVNAPDQIDGLIRVPQIISSASTK